MFENPRRGRQARNFTINVPKILDLKSSSEQIFFRKLSLGAPDSAAREKKALVPRLIMIFHNIIQVLEIMTAADSKSTNDVNQGKQRSQNN